ncbi:Uncharacterised protein [Enterobacter hormaechei]|uniref:hypothetical protein n=1 Tax=Enterobacter hormaechei TaxID=158836 RepID=UPI00079B236E|nr:hypothetical protein [Enterobacter hormaechei]CZV06606.1 Uncharacterised protein [Enterobacter hormaechei]
MNKSSNAFSLGRFVLSFSIFCYISGYVLLSLKLLYVVSIGDYSFLPALKETLNNNDVEKIKLALFTILGAILGGATLGIVSLHKYSAVTKSLDIDHVWGYLMAPILSIIIGVLIFCFLQSGLFVLTGDNAVSTENFNVRIGYISLGAICSYNWDVFIIKLQRLSSRITDA